MKTEHSKLYLALKAAMTIPAVALLAPSVAQATAYSANVLTGNWDTNATWTPVGVPNAAADSATIARSGGSTVTLSANPHSITSVTVGAAGISNNALNITGGSLTTSGSFRIVNQSGSAATVGGGSLTVNDAAVGLRNQRSLTLSSGSITATNLFTNSGANAITTISGGTFSAPVTYEQLNGARTNVTGGTVNIGTLNNVTGAGNQFNVSGGTVTAATVNNGKVLSVTGTGAFGTSATTLNQQVGGSLTFNHAAATVNNLGALNLAGDGTTTTTVGANDTVRISTDYKDATSGTDGTSGFGVGNSFNRYAHIGGGGSIVAAGTAQLGLDVNGGGAVAGNGTMTLNVHVGGSTSQNYQVANVGALGSGPAIRGALQTIGTGNITDARLSGAGVAASNYTTATGIAAGSSGGNLGVTFNGAAAGGIAGQAVQVVDNFGRIATLTIDGGAYDYATAALHQTGGDGTLTPDSPTGTAATSYTLDFGNIAQGSGTQTSNLDVLNLLSLGGTSAFTDLLNGTFDLSGIGSFTTDFLATGFVSDIMGGGASLGENVYFNPTALGLFTGDIVFHPVSKNAAIAGGSWSLSDITLHLTANVYDAGAVPEPAMLWLFGSAGVGLAAVRRRQGKRKDQ
jgi:hypothetical protein